MLDVERIRRGELHAVRRLHRLDAALQCVVRPALRGEVFAIERLHEIELPTLRGGIELRVT